MRPFLLALTLVLPALGCKPSAPALAKVRGTVIVNGQPLRGGTVVFVPDRQRGGRGEVSHALVGDDGQFELACASGPGAALGWHRVTVAPPPDAPELAARMEKYRYPDQSGLAREVKAGDNNSFEFRIEVEP